MTAPPLVSGIIIFLNEERFLAEAIDSVLAQTYSAWELILVDDGSTDRSSAIARDYARRDPDRIRCVEHAGHANFGMSASRNLGIAHARGRFCGFLDADDVWLPDKLREQVALLEAHPQVAMVYGRTLLWHGWRDAGSAQPADLFCDLGVPPDTIVEPPELLLRLIENRVQTPTTCNALLRREVIERVLGFEPVFRGMFEDQVFFMKVCLAERVYVSSQCWAKYRQREDSSSAKAEAAGQVGEARRRLLAWLSQYLRERDSGSRAVWRMLGRQRCALRWPRMHGLLLRARALARQGGGADRGR